MATATSAPAPTPALAPFVRQQTVLLTSYRRDGTPVGTPVSIAVEGDRAYFRTYDVAWKTKRLRRNPEVTIAPSTARGRATGPALRTRARCQGARTQAPAPARRARPGLPPPAPLPDAALRADTIRQLGSCYEASSVLPPEGHRARYRHGPPCHGRASSAALRPRS